MTTSLALPCPVCGRPADPPPSACPRCGLPAAGQAALVVARIGATLRELAADRDALLGTLRAAARPAPAPEPAEPVPAPLPAPAPADAVPTAAAPRPAPGPWTTAAPRLRAPRRRLSPQQVLLGLGALLLVAAALAFVAVAWTRLGVGFQAAVMSAVTAAACAASAWTARRGLRATEEALAAAGTALLVVDLAAARHLGLFGLETVPWRTWTAVSLLAVVAAGLLLGRLTPSTATWPLAALLAVHPAPFLLLPAPALDGPAACAVALGLAALDLAVAVRIRDGLRRPALALALAAAFLGTAQGLLVAAFDDSGDVWVATALLAAASAGATAAARRVPVLRPRRALVAGAGAAVTALATSTALDWTDPSAGQVGAAVGGLALLVLAVLLDGRRTAGTAAWSAGGTAVVTGSLFLAGSGRWAALSAVALAAVVPAALAAVRRPGLRVPATGAAVGTVAASVVLAEVGDVLRPVQAGLLLALVAAAAFATAAYRSGEPEERVAAGAAGVVGLAAALSSADVGAWGQVGLQLALVGAAAAGYALVSGRRQVAALAVGDLVVAAWIALAGAAVSTPEAYTLPAAAGLLLVAVPRIRAAAPSWSAEGPGLAVALAPSALVVVADPTAMRLVAVVLAAAVLTVGGTRLHRQAPFVVGAGALAFVAVGLLGPDVLVLPRWLSLGAVGVLLLALGATYERRRQQARETVAWVGQMR